MTYLQSIANFKKISNSPGQSKESIKFQEFTFDANELNKQSFTSSLEIILQNRFAEIYDIRQECSISNWDGYNAIPLNNNAIIELIEFILLLPNTYNDFEIIPEPNGNIALEWFNDIHHIVISFSGTNKIKYASIFNSLNKKHGEEIFYGIIPNEIDQMLYRFYLN